MLRKSKIIIAVLLVLLLFASCGSNLKQTATIDTLSNHKLTFSIPENWVYDSDGDITYFSESMEKIENDDWYMMLSANLISTVGEDATALDIANKNIVSDFNEKLVHTDELSKNCVFVKAEGNELSYFIVTDKSTGLYIYGRTYNSAVDIDTAKEIAKKIKLS